MQVLALATCCSPQRFGVAYFMALERRMPDGFACTTCSQCGCKLRYQDILLSAGLCVCHRLPMSSAYENQAKGMSAHQIEAVLGPLRMPCTNGSLPDTIQAVLFTDNVREHLMEMITLTRQQISCSFFIFLYHHTHLLGPHKLSDCILEFLDTCHGKDMAWLNALETDNPWRGLT